MILKPDTQGHDDGRATRGLTAEISRGYDQKGSAVPPRLARPKHLLPKLHDKTHFKAAIEYSLGDQVTTRSLHDDQKEIERYI